MTTRYSRYLKRIGMFSVVAITILLVNCEPPDPRNFPLVVHTGAEWRVMSNGNPITTYRDNPPLTGIVTIAPGQVLNTPSGTPYFRVDNPRIQGAFIWDHVDFRLEGSFGKTFRSDQNVDGFLGISPAGPLPSSGARRARWHSNGLLLRPGETINLDLQRRRFVGAPYTGQWRWESVPDADAGGRLVLDQGTALVGVTVIVVRQGEERMISNRALAELWFDGRTVDRLGQSLSSGGNLNSYITDRDLRSTYDPDQFDNPSQGRSIASGLMQEIDKVWCYCGVHFQKNIQFRLVRYREILSSEIANFPADISAISGTQLEYWVAAVASHVNQLAGVPADAPPTIPIVIVSRYGRTGVAQTWRTGIIFGEQDVFTNGGGFPEHTMAHELGHFLGGDSSIFNDGVVAAPNLMSGNAPVLLSQQCDVAYRGAGAYVVR